ncbi:MAG: protein kinase [Verrucomicrobia bacterium]|nr:protein kinase [Verrucomicrobiota bacterium]
MADFAKNPNALRPIHCYFCSASNFVSPDLPPMTTMPCNKCGKEIMIPYLLRNFEIRQVIASGGMGTVYRAFDTILKREVAVKLMKKELGRDAKMLDEFYREARMIAALNHPNIIQVFNFGEMDGENFIAMELADRGSLESRALKNDGRVSELEVLDVGVKIGAALDAAYKQNLLHRDIKPANILFNADNEPKLVDFGLAREADKEDEYGAEVWGTPEYSAPEKFKRESETFKSDMYSLGCTLYQALTGKLPFAGPSVEEMVRGHLDTPPKPPLELVPEISPATSDALLKSLAKKPKERFASYEELVMAFTAARSQVLVGQLAEQNAPGGAKARTTKGLAPAPKKTAPVPVGKPVARPVRVDPEAVGDRNKFALIAVMVVGLAAMAGGVWFFMNHSSGDPAARSATTNDVPAVAVPPPAPLPAPGEWLTLSVSELATRFASPNGRPLSTGWQFTNNEVRFDGGGLGGLATIHEFTDFDLSFEWKAAKDAPPGAVAFALGRGAGAMDDAFKFVLRAQTNAGAQSAGSLAGVIAAATNATVRDPKDFNISRLVVLTNRAEFWINGRRAVGFNLGGEPLATALAESEMKSRPNYGKAVPGRLGFEAPRGVALRNVRVRVPEKWPTDLPVPSIRLNLIPRPEVTSPTFTSLSDTNSIKLWRAWNGQSPPPASSWKFESGFITALGGDRAPMLVTRERYVDFELTFDWKVDKGVKTAVIFGLQSLPYEASQNAYRIVLADDAAETTIKKQSGALYGLIAPSGATPKPVGQYNSARVAVFNNRAEVWINGVKCTEFDLAAKSFKDSIPKSEYRERPLFGKTSEGWIAFQPAAGLSLRSVRIRAIAEAPKPPPGAKPAPKKK